MPTLSWLKSSFSDAGGNNCIELATDGSGIAIRESSEPSAVLHTDRIALRTFISGVKRGYFDRLMN
ncbi:DUF397 domain-containing protein [Streptomyces asiaticus]|uniref:DUF397 domain-containing protein n=1 Tax=Streptomyces asiaticus TaxID=114695 RepID=UPI003D72766B